MAIGVFSTSKYIDLGDLAQYKITGQITIMAYLYPTQNETATILSKWQGVTAGRSWMFQLTNRAPRIYVSSTGSNNSTAVGTSASLNTWTHCAVRWDGSVLQCFNGGTTSGSQVSFAGPIYDSSITTKVGIQTTKNAYTGYIYDLRVYNRSVTNTEISMIANSYGVDGISNSLVLRTAISDLCVGNANLNGLILKDHSSYKNNAIVIGDVAAQIDPYSPWMPLGV